MAKANLFDFLAAGLTDTVTGDIYNGAIVAFFAVGTSNAKAVWTDADKTLPTTAGLSQTTLNSNGQVNVYGDGRYDVKVYASTDTLLASPTMEFDDVGFSFDAASTADTIQDLKDLGSGHSLTEVQVMGYYDVGDGGGGPIRYWSSGQPAGTYVDNGGSIIVPTGGDGSAAWLWEWTGPHNAEWFGAKGDGVTDDTTAIAAANAVGPTVFTDTYVASSLTITNDIIGPGKLLRKAGSTGDFVTTGADGLTIDCEIDENSTAGDALQINHDNTTVKRTAILRNALLNGIRVDDSNDVKIYAQVFDCVQTHIIVKATSADITGLDIDAIVDGVSLGTSNANGGIKVQGTAGTFGVIRPRIRGIVRLGEDAAMPANTACVETHTNVTQPDIDVIVEGGSIGITMNNSPGGKAKGTASGQHNIQFEIGTGSDGARFYASSGRPGATVTPLYGFQSSAADDVAFEGRIEDATTAPAYVDGGSRGMISGSLHSTASTHLVRVRGFSDLTVNVETAIKDSNSGTAFVLDTSTGSCDNLRIIGGRYDGIANFITNTTAVDNISISGGCIIDNSGVFFAGAGTMTDMRISEDCNITTLPFGAQVEDVRVTQYSQTGAALIDATGTGTPENAVTAAIGSTYRRKDGSAATSFYIKESGTGNTGWVGK